MEGSGNNGCFAALPGYWPWCSFLTKQKAERAERGGWRRRAVSRHSRSKRECRCEYTGDDYGWHARYHVRCLNCLLFSVRTISLFFFLILCVSKNRKCSGSIWRITSQVWSWIKLKYWSKRKVLEDWVHLFFCYCQPLASGCMDANYSFSKCVNLFLAINSRRLLV